MVPPLKPNNPIKPPSSAESPAPKQPAVPIESPPSDLEGSSLEPKAKVPEEIEAKQRAARMEGVEEVLAASEGVEIPSEGKQLPEQGEISTSVDSAEEIGDFGLTPAQNQAIEEAIKKNMPPFEQEQRINPPTKESSEEPSTKEEV